MEVAELRPGDRDHLARGVELHRARAERDHGAVERDVLVREAPQVAQHLGLRVVAVEDRVREVGARPGERRGDALPRPRRGRAGEKAAGLPAKIAHRSATSSRVVVSSNEKPSVASSTRRRLTPEATARSAIAAVASPRAHGERVEERGGRHLEAQLRESRARDGREAVHAARDAREPLPGRGRRRTSTPSPRAAPARCRCWRSPSRGGCAARASAARGGRRGCRGNPPSRRPGARACCA